jgi:hypothetical protein
MLLLAGVGCLYTQYISLVCAVPVMADTEISLHNLLLDGASDTISHDQLH